MTGQVEDAPPALEEPGSGPAPAVPLYAHVFRALLASWFVALAGGVLVAWLGFGRSFARFTGADTALDVFAVAASVASLFGIAYGASLALRRRVSTPLAAALALALAILGGRYLAELLGDPLEAVMRTVSGLDVEAGWFFLAALLPASGLFLGLRLGEERGLGLLGEVRAATLGAGTGVIVVLPGVDWGWRFNSPFVCLVILLLSAGLTPLGLRIGGLLVNRLAARLDGSTPWPDARGELTEFLSGLREPPREFELGAWRARLREALKPDPGSSELYRLAALALGACFVALIGGIQLRWRPESLTALTNGAGACALLGYALLPARTTEVAPTYWRKLALGFGVGLLLLVLWRSDSEIWTRLATLGFGVAVLSGLVSWRVGVAVLGLCLTAFAWVPFCEEVGIVLDPIVSLSWRTLPEPFYPVPSGLLLLLLAIPPRPRRAQALEVVLMLGFGVLGGICGLRLAALPGAWHWDYELLFSGLTISAICAAPAAALGAWLSRRPALAVAAALSLAALASGLTTYERRLRELPYSEANQTLLARAEAGDLEAAYLLGRNLRYGIGEPDLPGKQPAAAWNWIRRAAEGGHAEAMYRYGIELERGPELRRDPELAEAWLERAAGAGSERARSWLAERGR